MHTGRVGEFTRFDVIQLAVHWGAGFCYRNMDCRVWGNASVCTFFLNKPIVKLVIPSKIIRTSLCGVTPGFSAPRIVQLVTASTQEYIRR